MYNVHFIGIGGIGMSALARWFKAHGHSVSGSDLETSSITKELKKDGIRVFTGHKANHIPGGTRLVIRTSAIPVQNPELKRAHALHIPTKVYAEALGTLTREYKTLTISGSHGKSTTTALLSMVLTRAGFDPTVVIGTKLKEFRNSNFRNGKSNYLVLEADEHNAAFLHYSPTCAIITNIDREHLDFYKNINNEKKTFLTFISNIKRGGILVVNKDDTNLFSLKVKIQKIAKEKNIQVLWYGIRVDPRLYRRVSSSLQIPGAHNASNALAAYTLARALGVKDQTIIKALKQYKGAWRRMEYKGQLRIKNLEFRIKVYDDYAHHPTEIRATLAGIAQKWPKSRVICVFEPHQAKRLALLFKAFTEAFWAADALVLLPIYKVSGRDKVTHNISSEKLAKAIQAKLNSKFPPDFAWTKSKRAGRILNSKLTSVTYLPSPKKDLKKKIIEVIQSLPRKSALSLRESAIIVMMGAGDIYRLTDSLIES